MITSCVALFSSCTLSHTITCTNNPVGTKTGVVKTKIFGDQDISYATANVSAGMPPPRIVFIFFFIVCALFNLLRVWSL